MSAKKYVCNNAVIVCPLCTKTKGKLIVTSNTVKLQDKTWATVKDGKKPNLQFTGNCKKSDKSSVPCASLIAPDQWKNTGDILIQDNKALLDCSTIKCNYGGATISIENDLQITELPPMENLDVDSISPDQAISNALVSSKLSK